MTRIFVMYWCFFIFFYNIHFYIYLYIFSYFHIHTYMLLLVACSGIICNFYNYIYFSFVYVVCLLQHACKGQVLALRSQFSLSATCVGIQVWNSARLVCWQGSLFVEPHLVGHQVLFLKWVISVSGRFIDLIKGFESLVSATNIFPWQKF